MALYICPTPIGNIKDITIRVLEVLNSVNYIAAEDTRVTRKLMTHYNIKTRLIHYDDHHKNNSINNILGLLKEGNDVALVSDAGTPLISDPGNIIVSECIKNNIDIVSLPGPSAFLSALVLSGVKNSAFSFYGFAPRKQSERLKFLTDLVFEKNTLIFYEAPHRLKKFLDAIYSVFGKREIVVVRELTKIYEEVIRATTDIIIDKFDDNNLRGEFVIILQGYEGKNNSLKTIEEELIEYINSGISKKDAVKIISKERNIAKKEVYKKSLEI